MLARYRRLVPWFVLLMAAVVSRGAYGTQAGVWQFNNNLNNAVSGGSALSVNGGWAATYMNETIGGQPATVLSFPAMTNSQALDMPNQGSPNGTGGTPTKNNWSVVMDLKFPVLNSYTSLWETSTIGLNDGDFFIRDDSQLGSYGSVGISGQYAGVFNADTWTRLAVTVSSTATPDTYTVTSYLDGVLAGTATTGTPPGGKEALRTALHLFTDDDFETSAGYVNSVAYYGEVLDAPTIGSLGGATAAGIPAAVNQVGRWNFDNNLTNSIAGRSAMSAIGGWTPTYVAETIAGSPATVLSFPAMDNTQALDMPNQATPDDFGVPTTTNIWSIVMDVKFPTLSSYTSLWETAALGTTDGEYFIKDVSGNGTSGSLGISQQYAGTFNADTWTRLAVTIDGSVDGGNYTVTGYVDGVPVSSATTDTAPNGREAVKAILHLFADEDGESSAGLINSLAYYDELLTPEAILALGGATAAGIPVVTPPGVPGDYNQNGVVDAADYVVWRNNLGSAVALPNEGSGITPGSVTTEDYTYWRSRYGATSGAGSVLGGAVPEPSAWLLLTLITGLSTFKRYR
jgi:hypothetical protein